MARIRTIKPDFWSDDSITECSVSARLLFIGTWNFADDYGNLDRSAKQIKIRVFPVDNIDCEPLIQELITHGLLIEYSVSEKKYLHIPGFIEHQIINRPSKPSCPAFDESLRTHATLTEHSVIPHSGREGSIGKGSRTRSVKAAIPFPDDFTLSPDLADQATKRYPDADLTLMFEQFRAHHVSHGSTMKSWPAAWTTWLGNAAKFGYPKKPGGDLGWR
ncbi:MAG TPA: hypothetical protein PLK99_06545 [Burkholderiales bacterium]|nr:hypothetical protein [Burkholderiales bacterium]